MAVLISGNKTVNKKNELYSEGRKAIRWFEKNHPDDFDIYSEPFFATLKTEELYHKQFRRREEVYHCIFEYIELFYNRQRLHSSIRYKTPAEFEAA